MSLDDNLINIDVEKLNIKDLSLLLKIIKKLDTKNNEDIEVI